MTALELWPACHRQEPWIPEGGWPSIAPRFASLGPEGGASPFGLHRTHPSGRRGAFSSRLVPQLPRHQRWRCGFGSASASLAGLRPGIGGGGNKAAVWTGRRRDPHAASKGTTTRGIGSALFAGQVKAQDAIRTVIRTLIAPFLPILRRHAVTSVAFSVPKSNAFSDFGVGNAAVGQSNAIAHGFDLLSPIAFAHVFQLDCWPGRYCFCLCIFVAQESEFHGVNRDG